MRKISKKLLLGILSFMLLYVLAAPVTSVTYGFNPPAGSHVVSNKKTTLVPGVVESEVIYNTPDGKNPVSGFIVDINLGSSVGIMAASKDYNKRGTQTVRGMVDATIANTGRNIVAAINADLNWSGTGESAGPLIIDGTLHTDKATQFFGIRKNGEAVIGDGTMFNAIKHDLDQAVKGMGWLVRDGEVVASSTSLAPRTAVGLKADGTVFFYVVEGRMYPRSIGISLKDLAEIMRSYGAVMALNMDGGGSSTYLSKSEGQEQIQLRNIPSDGTERESITSLLVYADVGDGTFHHAALTTMSQIYTPNSEVQFSARGVDSAGGFAEIPEGLIWKLENNAFGTINQDGIFVSSGLEGNVKVYLEDSSGRKVGDGNVEIRTPDAITFLQEEFSLGFDEATDFGIRATYQQRLVQLKDGDIIWDYDPALGVFENNKFLSNADESASGIIRATIANTDIFTEFSLVVGKLPIVIFDFENDLINEKWEASTVNGGISEISFVHRDSGEPVRFGNQSMRLDFDFTKKLRYPAGAYAGFTDREGLEDLGVTFQLPGTPTGVGMWIYATEEAQGLWLRSGIGVEGTTSWKAFNLVEEASGIDWIGWKYVEFSLTDYAGPYTMLPGQFIRMMLTSNSFGGDTSILPVGSIYIDNITVNYGTNIEDVHAPTVESIMVNDEEVVNGQVLNTNNITIETTFYDFEDKYTSGIDYENINIYVDGVNYINQPGYALNITDDKAYLQNVFLTDGTHEIKIVVVDNAGNETIERRYITIQTGKNDRVYLEEVTSPLIGKEYILELKADDINNLDDIYLSLQISNTLSNFVLEFNEDFEGSFEYLSGVRLLNISAKQLQETEKDYIVRIKFSLSSSLTESSTVTYSINIGEFSYVEDNTDGLFLKGFSTTPRNLNVIAPLRISSNIVLVGKEALFYVRNHNGELVPNAEIFMITNDGRISLGVTDEDGFLTTSVFSDEVTRFTLFAELGDDISFEFTSQSLNSTGEANGKPFNIKLNGINSPEESKNVVWFSNSLAENKNAYIQYALKSQYNLLGEEAFVQQEGTSRMFAFTGSTNIEENYAINVNNVVIDGLVSGKEYVYRVGNGKVWSENRTFKTVYQYSDVNFVILGDIQTQDYDLLRNTLDYISNDGVDYDFAIQVGDFVDDAGTFGHWDGVLSAITESSLGNIDIIQVLGNHEFYGDPSGEKAKTIFNFPGDNDKYYSMDYGVVYVAVINYTMSRTDLTNALEWLVEDANDSNAKWKILITHQPPYYTNPQGGSEMFNELLPTYAEQAGIDVVFSGHDHAYGRTRAVLDGQIDSKGVTYILTGAVGEKRYPAVDNTEFNFEELNHNFESIYLSIQASEEYFRMTVNDINGEEIDSYTKHKDMSQHEHNYYLEDDRLVCYECYYNRPIGDYTGFVKMHNGNIMYLLIGDIYTGLLVLGNSKYYFNEDGYAYTGNVEIMGLEAKFDETGKFISGGTGFVKYNNKTFYYINLSKHDGWLNLDDSVYYFYRVTYEMAIGDVVFSGIPYTFDINGKLIKGHWEHTDDGMRYYFGGLVKGWKEIDGFLYYFSTAYGHMRTGKSYIDLHEGIYEFNEHGQLITGAFVNDGIGIKYYFGSQLDKENYSIGFQEIDNNIYYFDNDGYMKTNSFYLDGYFINVKNNGVVIFK